MTKKEAFKITGGLSRTTKMPGASYGLPPSHCKTGSKLHKIEGSVCQKCYARKGFYTFDSAKGAHSRRIASLSNPQWVEAMATLITIATRKEKYFRWHDSGDIQDIHHLKNIVQVCLKTPDVKHWLPTHEYAIIKEYLDEGNIFPENLVVRISSPMIDGKAINTDLPTSTVSRRKGDVEGYACPASQQKNKCGSCRACWDANVKNVDYKYH